jgi:predicted transcriptional regulator
MKTHSARGEKSLTETELELMNFLWKLGEGSVNDVLAELPPSRQLAYTSVSTILRILEQKKILGSRKEGRGHIYFPKLSKSEYETATIKNVVSKVFNGAPLALVRQLLDTNKLSAEDLKEMKKLLDERIG